MKIRECSIVEALTPVINVKVGVCSVMVYHYS